MVKLNFHIGVTLRCYGNVEIEAESVEAALPLLTADFIGSNIDITETTTDSGQDLAIIDVSNAETGEDIEEWDEVHFLPSPYDPQPDAELLAALKPFAEAAAVISDDLSDETLLFAHFPSLFGKPTELRVGTFRKAAAALAKIQNRDATEPPTKQCDDWPGCACGRGGPDHCKAAPAMGQISHPFDPFAETMEAEGWCVIEASGTGKWSVQCDDETEDFADDDAALSHVERRAAEGSEPHKAALAFVKAANDEIEKEDRTNG